MAPNWSQGGSRPYGTGSTAQAYERPPTCFKCGEEGHFVINCPQSKQSAHDGLPNRQGVNVQRGNGPAYGPQPLAYNNGQAPGAVVTRYPVPKPAPVVTRYPVALSASPGTANSTPGGYAPPGQAPQQYQQYTSPAPQSYPQHSPPPQVPYASYSQAPSYSAPQPPYSQTSHAYGAPAIPPQQQYGYQGNYQPQQGYNQYSQPSTAPHYAASAYQPPAQPYAQPQTPYPTQPAPYQVQNGGYDPSYNYGTTPTLQHQPTPPQWNATPPQAQPYTAPPYQQPQAQYSAGYEGQYDQSNSQAPYPPQPQAYAAGEYDYQQPSQAAGYEVQQNQTASAYPYPGNSTEQKHMPGPYQQSRVSSVAGTPYGSRRGSIASSQGGSGHANSDQQDKGAPVRRVLEQLSEEDQQFNWSFKKIFKEDIHQPAVPIHRPFPSAFEDDTWSLYYPDNSTDTVSKYVSKNNVEEFKQSIRSSHLWPSIQQDPVYSDIRHEAPLIPLADVAVWLERRYKQHTTIEDDLDCQQAERSRKRAWSDEQEDVDNQISLEAMAEHQSAPQVKRQKSSDISASVTTVFDDRQDAANAGPGTPVLGRSGTPSIGAEDDVWAPQAGEGEDPTEARLAALGVSGKPKPVEPMDPVLLPEDFHSYRGYTYPPQSHDSGYVSSNVSNGNGSDPNTYKTNGYNQDYAPQWPGQPPPPPPPPPQSKTTRPVDGATDSESPPHDRPQDKLSPPLSIGVVQSASTSPTVPAETTVSQEPPPRRKIVRVISGKKSEPLRQEDDVTPKFKRSQPVVAEAYSRRW